MQLGKNKNFFKNLNALIKKHTFTKNKFVVIFFMIVCKNV